jgi:hypothetical protein
VDVIVRGAERLRRVGDDPVAGSGTGVDDGRVQDVRAEGSDLEDRRTGRRRAALAIARAASREGPKYRRCLPLWVARRTRWRRRVAHAPALDIWIEVCGHKGEKKCVVRRVAVRV